jgi:uncharacterized protein (DUF4415 family)
MVVKELKPNPLSADAGGSGKIKITINIDQDILGILRTEAANTGIPYQRLINQLLRKALQQNSTLESRLERLEKRVNKLKRKLND